MLESFGDQAIEQERLAPFRRRGLGLTGKDMRTLEVRDKTYVCVPDQIDYLLNGLGCL